MDIKIRGKYREVLLATLALTLIAYFASGAIMLDKVAHINKRLENQSQEYPAGFKIRLQKQLEQKKSTSLVLASALFVLGSALGIFFITLIKKRIQFLLKINQLYEKRKGLSTTISILCVTICSLTVVFTLAALLTFSIKLYSDTQG